MSGGLYNTSNKKFDTTLNLKELRPYGDTMNDGKVQMSFTLPVKNDDKGQEAAIQLAKKMGLNEPSVACAKTLDEEFTFYIVYGECAYSVDYTSISVQTVDNDVMSMEETDEFIRENFGRKLVVVGASTGTDAHTVGIDAIMNRKGFAGHYGLERYDMIEAYNMGSQVPNEEFIAKAKEHTACKSDCHAKGNTYRKSNQSRGAHGGGAPARQGGALLRRRKNHARACKGVGLRRGLRSGQICRRRNFFRRERNA